MSATDSRLARIARDARPLYEQLAGTGGGRPPDGEAGRSGDPRETIWLEALGTTDPAALGRRLRWDGLRRLNGAAAPAAAGEELPELPSWAALVRDAADAAERLAPWFRRSPGSLAPARAVRIPFADLLAPIVSVARRRVRSTSSADAGSFAASAVEDLEWGLWLRLSEVSALTLQLEFSAYRSLAPPPASAASDNSLYRSFVAELLSAGMLPLFDRYPVLARLTGTVAECWVETTLEVMGRWAADRRLVGETLFGLPDPGPVVAVETRLSDPHDGGRQVLALRLRGGERLIYKPRGIEVEAAFNRLLERVNRELPEASLRVLRMIPRPGYGWAEYVESAPCQDPEQVAAFFRRFGMLACLVYALDGTDCHCENLIAAADQPVLVDLETLFHPRTRAEAVEIDAADFESHSILRTGLFPARGVEPGLADADMSALGGAAEQQTRVWGWHWSHLNRDAMTVRSEQVKTGSVTNVPTLRGERAAGAAHLDAILDGFRGMYRFLREDGRRVLERAVAELFDGSQVRYIFRPSQIYASLQKKALEPRYLGHGCDRGLCLDRLGRALVKSGRRPRLWPLLRVEHGALERMDVPIFRVPIGANALVDGDGTVVDGCFESAPRAQVAAQLRRLGRADETVQTGLIRGALCARTADFGPGGRAPASDDPVGWGRAIGEQLRRTAVTAEDGVETWSVPHQSAESDRFRIRTMADDLYEGRAGIALFFAALAKVTGESGYRRTASRLLDAIVGARRGGGPAAGASAPSIGGALGLGSLVYSLLRAADLLEAPGYLEAALEVAGEITPERVRADRSLDVMSGAAGAALALVAAHRATGERWLLERALLCGARLAAAAGPAERRGWKTAQGRTATGFAHGAAGIAYALAALSEASGEAGFERLALEAAAIEDDVESSRAERAPAPPEGGPHGSATSAAWVAWCNGAAGIGLGRLGMLRFGSRPGLRRSLRAAVERTIRAEPADLDQICCGNLGRVELLLTAGRRLGDARARREGERLLAAVLSRAARAGAFRCSTWRAAPFHPGLFQGTAGIGYQLLRAAHPESLPALLLWE